MNLFAEELPQRPISMPRFNLPPLDLETEMREAAERVAERRVIRAGLEAWRAIGKAESFESWRAIGAALALGKARAQRIAGEADNWRDRNYIYEFSKWMRNHGFGSMPKSVRSVAIELYENIQAIEAWRATLPERQRKRLIHPLSNVRRWRAATTYRQITGRLQNGSGRGVAKVSRMRCRAAASRSSGDVEHGQPSEDYRCRGLNGWHEIDCGLHRSARQATRPHNKLSAEPLPDCEPPCGNCVRRRAATRRPWKFAAKPKGSSKAAGSSGAAAAKQPSPGRCCRNGKAAANRLKIPKRL
jgi:hypothetical protein